MIVIWNKQGRKLLPAELLPPYRRPIAYRILLYPIMETQCLPLNVTHGYIRALSKYLTWEDLPKENTVVCVEQQSRNGSGKGEFSLPHPHYATLHFLSTVTSDVGLGTMGGSRGIYKGQRQGRPHMQSRETDLCHPKAGGFVAFHTTAWMTFSGGGPGGRFTKVRPKTGG